VILPFSGAGAVRMRRYSPQQFEISGDGKNRLTLVQLLSIGPLKLYDF